MPYNTENAKEKEFLPGDSILDGEIVKIKDGFVKDFVLNPANWQSDVENPAIEIDVLVNGQKISQIFTYLMEGQTMTYTKNSNLGKFKRKYGELPRVGLKIKIQTSSEGFGRVKLN